MSMSLNNSISTALSGLRSESAALSNISTNVANSSTVGYKESDTDFESMVLGNGTGGAVSAGVSTVTQMDVTTAGQIQSTGVSYRHRHQRRRVHGGEQLCHRRQR